MNHKIIIIVFLLPVFFNEADAQEFLMDLHGNASIHNHWLKQKDAPKSKTRGANDTIRIPFFDDFSLPTIYPDTSLWADKQAFINGDYPLFPPSTGVATLDAIDYNGAVYNHLNYNQTGAADALTSKPIRLNSIKNPEVDKNKTFLSFFYQPQGIGDAPELGDSLVLQFYAPEDDKWITVWKRHGETYAEFKKIFPRKYDDYDIEFEQVIVQIADEKFFRDGFRFRFKNYVSLSGSHKPDYAGNVDHWHIDYVMLNSKGLSYHQNISDVAFVYPLQSILSEYTSMPWTHFQTNPADYMKKQMVITYINNDPHKDGRNIHNLQIVFHDSLGTAPNDTIFAGSGTGPLNLAPGRRYSNTPIPLDKPPVSTENERALFEIRCEYTTDETDPTENNQISIYQDFNDTYSYDDGTAENGYGLAGEGTKNAMLAYKFETPVTDTLRAVKMYFNHTKNNANDKYFVLTIWDDNNGEPGEIIFSQIGTKPFFDTDSMHQFRTYNLDRSVSRYKITSQALLRLRDEGVSEHVISSLQPYEGLIYGDQETFTSLLIDDLNFTDSEIQTVMQQTNTLIIKGVFYVGWTQTAALLLNVGFDKNSTPEDKIFFNIRGEWEKSQFPGALMIRPQFGTLTQKSVSKVEELKDFSAQIYPNPVSDALHVRLNQNVISNSTQVILWNIYGKAVYKNILDSNQMTIPVSHFECGVYILSLKNAQQGVFTKKIVIER